MTKKSTLRSVLGAINKPKLPATKEQSFAAPPPLLPTSASLNESQGKEPVGNLPGGNQPGGQLPEGEQPPGNLPGGSLPVGDLPVDGSKSDSGNPSQGSPPLDRECDMTGNRIAKRREKLLTTAFQGIPELSPEAQSNMVKHHLGNGWGRLAHCVTQVLKAPTRFRLKLVDIALILTIYDRTIARVQPRMYAPISSQDFRDDTGMDESNIRVGLRSLVDKGAVLKISAVSINFWALNHAYLSTAGTGFLPPGKQPPGKLPGGKIPRVEQGNLPGGEGGQSTRGHDDLNSRNQKPFSAPKNLNQESEEESLSCEFKFPDDMTLRWKTFEKSGRFSNSKKEREIFQSLFSNHGKQFFDYCGRVVAFLEDQGTGKTGETAKIHSPMVWMDGHWELNFSRYQSWITNQQVLKEAQEQKAEQEAQKKIQAQKQEQAENVEKQEQARRQAKMDADTQRFINAYPSESEVNAFVERAVQLSECQFTLNSWRNLGWESPVVRSCVISHFLEVEASGEGRTSTQNPSRPSEATA